MRHIMKYIIIIFMLLILPALIFSQTQSPQVGVVLCHDVSRWVGRDAAQKHVGVPGPVEPAGALQRMATTHVTTRVVRVPVAVRYAREQPPRPPFLGAIISDRSVVLGGRMMCGIEVGGGDRFRHLFAARLHHDQQQRNRQRAHEADRG